MLLRLVEAFGVRAVYADQQLLTEARLDDDRDDLDDDPLQDEVGPR